MVCLGRAWNLQSERFVRCGDVIKVVLKGVEMEPFRGRASLVQQLHEDDCACPTMAKRPARKRKIFVNLFCNSSQLSRGHPVIGTLENPDRSLHIVGHAKAAVNEAP